MNPSPRRARAWALALALGLGAIAVRLPGLGRSLWYDELFTLRHFADSFGHAFASQRQANNHPLASILAWAASRVAGRADPEVLRAGSVLASALGVVALAWLVRRRCGWA